MSIVIQTADFDVGFELAKLRQPNVGATVSFVGTVRDFTDNRALCCMELEHYPGMTEKALQRIVNDAKARWDMIDATVIHRVGVLRLSEQIVLVAVACPHRRDAFSACEYIIDYLKTDAPFWKKEVSEHGEQWVDARDSDSHALHKWEGLLKPPVAREKNLP